MLCTTLHKTPCIYIYVLENEFFLTTALQQRKCVDAVECFTFCSGLIGVFVFDILQIPIYLLAPPGYGPAIINSR